MTVESFEFKVVVSGPFGVGKTTLISNVSNVQVVGTEVPTTGAEAEYKETTTVGLEYGLFEADTDEFNLQLLLYGTPGQARFRYMWDVASEGADGHIVLVDATRPDTWADAAEVMAFFARRSEACVLGVNRASPGSGIIDAVARRLAVPADVPIVACDVTEEASGRALLVELFSVILDRSAGSPKASEETKRSEEHHGSPVGS